MSLESVPKVGQNGVTAALRKILVEQQGLRIAVVAGAAAGTKMNVAAMRTEDTILAALVEDTTSGVTSADDSANVTIQSTTATGTVTAASVSDGDTVTVDDKTFTFKTTVVADAQIAIGADDTASATNLKNAVNAWQNRYTGTLTRKPKVIATSALGVVTLTAAATLNPAVADAAGNAVVLLSSNGSRLAVTGSGTLTNGTDTGGIKSTTNLTGKALLLFWYNKQ
jgi:hypothetical protein